MAAYLHDQGHDVWVAELRTSVALDSWQHPWSFDDVATRDIPALVKLVHSNSHQKVRVFAHCVGSVMFWSSVLQGKLTGLIEKAAFTQVGLATHLPPINHARSRLIGLLREAISLSTFETNPSDDPDSSESLIERAFTTFPYQSDQWWRLRGKPFAKRSWEAQYHRITALHGELMNLRNVSDQVLNDLHNQLGGSNLSTYMQSLYFSRGRVTNSDGLNLVTRTSLREHVEFPCFFGSGDRNRVFEPQNAEDSALLLNEAHGYGGASVEVGSTSSAYGLPHQYVVFHGYGHQDTLIGKRSAQDVFKPIADFFAKPAPARLLRPQARQWTAYASTMGPVVGWLRREPQESGGPGSLKVRVSFTADRIAGKPRWILALLASRTRKFPQPVSTATNALAGYWINPGGDSIVVCEDGDQTALDPCRYCIDLPIANPIISKLGVTEPGADLEVFLLGLFDDEAVLRRNDCLPACCLLPAVIQDSIAAPSEAGARQDIELGADQRQLWLAFIEHQLADTPVQADSQFCQTPRHQFTRPEQTSRSTSQARGERDPGFNPASFLLRREALLAADQQAHSSLASKGNSIASSRRITGKSFRQMPELPHRTSQPALSFVLASCQSMSLPFDSVVAGQSYERLADLLEREPQQAKGLNVPQLLLLVGDQVYLDPWVGLIDAPTGLEKIRQPYEAWLAHASVRRTLRAIPTYMTLDDHEVQNEWEPSLRNDRFTADSLRAFKLYQRSMGPDLKSNWYPLWPAGMPFFMLDTRTERSARNLFIRDQAQIISDRQMSALLDWLKTEQQIDPTRPKFIVSASVIVPGATRDLAEPAQAMGSDGWSGYPKSLDQLFSFIATEQIQGVVLLQGDYHASVVTEVEVAKNPELSDAVRVLSVVSSGLYAPYGFVNTQSKDLDGAHDIPPATRRAMEGSNTFYRCRQSPAMYTSDPNFVVISVDPVPVDDENQAMGEPQRWRLVIDISTDSGTLSQAF